MMIYSNRNLYRVVETIAEKEIERNPIEFIRRESFQVGDNVVREEFFSFKNNDYDVEDEDEEYHNHEHAVEARFN